MTFDWPNLLGGAVASTLIAPFARTLLRFGYSIMGKGASSTITGVWYSAEYDSKSPDPTKRNTILKVRVRRRIDGKTVIEALDGLEHANPKRPTKWKVIGEVRNDVLCGTWKSTIPHSTRYGTVLLKFCDDGRAIGYYLGYAESPVYGYWIMSRQEDDLRSLADAILKKFRWNDLKALVDKNDPRHQLAKKPAPNRVPGSD